MILGKTSSIKDALTFLYIAHKLIFVILDNYFVPNLIMWMGCLSTRKW